MTARQFVQLGEDPPGVKLELVDGEVAVSPSPTPGHSFVVMMLATILNVHIREKKLGELHHDVDTLLDNFNMRRPDLLFYASDRVHLIGKTFMEGAPDLAIEVISPSSIEVDRRDKFDQYRSARVKHYWIADPVLRTLEGWELKRSKYVSCGRGQSAATIRLAPFYDLEIPMKELWRK